MNENLDIDQPAKTGTQAVHQNRVTPATFISTAALGVALLGLATAWAEHKPAGLVATDVQAVNMRGAPQLAGRVGHVGQREQDIKGQLVISQENLQPTPGQDCAATGCTRQPYEILRGSYVEDICVQSNWWIKAKAVAENARRTVSHSRELQAAGVISLEELQDRERDLDLALSSQDAARANLDLALGLCSEIERLSTASKQAAQRIEELETLVARLSN